MRDTEGGRSTGGRAFRKVDYGEQVMSRSTHLAGREKKGSRVDPSCFDAGNKVKGKKRHIPVDTLGLVLGAAIHPAPPGTATELPFVIVTLRCRLAQTDPSLDNQQA